MTAHRFERPTFWQTVRVLLAASRKRAIGRRGRQLELVQHRSGGSSSDWGGIGFIMTIVFMFVLNGMAGFVVQEAVESGQRVQAEHLGNIVVSRTFLDAVKQRETEEKEAASQGHFLYQDDIPSYYYRDEAAERVPDDSKSRAVFEEQLREEVHGHGSANLVAKGEVAPGLSGLAHTGRFPAALGSLVLLWWGLMLVCQGEGLELDVQRRRHPMWEWLLSHPAPPGAIFLAEMLSPIAANPIYWAGPLFVAVAYGTVYTLEIGALALMVIGVPLTIAAACLGKALEIGIVLRCSPRLRGAMIGLMSWFGFASMMLFFVGAFSIRQVVSATSFLISPLGALPWPWLGLFLGEQPDGGFSFLQGTLICWIFAAGVIAGSVWFSVWGTNRGLSGSVGKRDVAPARSRKNGTQFGREPLYRKEFLWFIRDRSAIIQVILIPLTVAGYQVFNLRRLLTGAQGAWNYLCGGAILFGTYFLWVLGPKSLSSEGNALWIALTWPRGLEPLLKAKAWLWSMISSVIVALVLCYAAFLFHAEIWKIALVGIAWYFFGRSMAEKSVTLVSVTSSSGEQEKIPAGRRWAAQLGMATFAIGVLTQQWHIAIMGIVYSYITAAAMWQNFRARLPYLYDPWSERIPPPPTLMHAMVAISILVEAGAVVTGLMLLMVGRENLGLAMAFSYGVCSVIVCLVTANFLSERGVTNRQVWHWKGSEVTEGFSPVLSLQRCIENEDTLVPQGPVSQAGEAAPSGESQGSKHGTPIFPTTVPGQNTPWLSHLAGAAAGVVLGILAHGYLAILHHIPSLSEMIRRSQDQFAQVPDLKPYYAIMAIGFAPFAEEYLFRGLLYKALDREWGGWKAVLGSAAFFAIYHPPLSWVPVLALGACNALLFKKTGRLLPAVLVHMTYNAVVLL